jgi:tripartite-type tricarboxylate transporter receptor subunit TctC
MKLPRRQFLHLAADAAALPAVPRIAQTYRTRSIHFIVGFAACGSNDISARPMGQWGGDYQAEVIVPSATAISQIAIKFQSRLMV